MGISVGNLNRKNGSFVAFLAIALLASCGGARDSNYQPPTGVQRQYTDDLGRKVTVPASITRAVSLAPNLTENIFAVGAGDRLVGVTTFCNYPEEAKGIAKVGDTMNPSIETIVALKPEVVFVSTASQIQAFMNILEANGITVYVTDTDSLEAIAESLAKFGELFGTSEQTGKLVANINSRLAVLAEAGAGDKTSVFVQISKEPLFTIGKQSFLTSALERTGARSVTSNVATAYPKLSKETALSMNPDVIILSDSEDNREPNEVFRNSPAVRNKRVISIEADLLSRPGPRLIDALEQISRKIRPKDSI